MIQIDQLSFSYSRKQKLFDGLSLQASAGNIYGLLGRNGAGKSSLLKIMSGLLFSKAGVVNIAGFNPADRYPDFLQEIYLVTEEFFLPAMSGKQFVNNYGAFYPRFSRQAFEEYLAEFNLSQKQKLSSLSYGQKKIFLLAFGLATNCKLLLLDEPTNGLDIPSKSLFRKIVARALTDERTFIISTHQVRDMEHLIDPIIILDQGKIIFNEDTASITQKLSFGKQAQLNDTNSIYSETTLGGYAVVKANTRGDETHLNLELLFNAAIHAPEKLNDLFRNSHRIE